MPYSESIKSPYVLFELHQVISPCLNTLGCYHVTNSSTSVPSEVAGECVLSVSFENSKNCCFQKQKHLIHFSDFMRLQVKTFQDKRLVQGSRDLSHSGYKKTLAKVTVSSPIHVLLHQPEAALQKNNLPLLCTISC